MVRREVLWAAVLALGHGLACGNGNPGLVDGAVRGGTEPLPDSAAPAAHPDEPPSALAVAAYLSDVLTPGGRVRPTPAGDALLDKGRGVSPAVDVALTSHQCWKVKDGYQCRSTVRTTTTLPNGRARSTLVEISNDYQWRGGRLFSARLEAMRAQPVEQARAGEAAASFNPVATADRHRP